MLCGKRLNVGRLNWRRLEDGVVAQTLSFGFLTVSTRRMPFVTLFVDCQSKCRVRLFMQDEIAARSSRRKCGLVRDLGLRLSETSRQQLRSGPFDGRDARINVDPARLHVASHIARYMLSVADSSERHTGIPAAAIPAKSSSSLSTHTRSLRNFSQELTLMRLLRHVRQPVFVLRFISFLCRPPEICRSEGVCGWMG